VVGLMSGTSADGVDAALVDLDGERVRVRAFATVPYPPSVREGVFRLFDPAAGRVDDLCHLNFAIGEVFASAVVRLCAGASVSLGSVDLIGSHGQTVWHEPAGRRLGRRKLASTLQIGEPSVIAERTGITTVADFRPRDMAAGGQGAPLVPYADFLLFRRAHRTRAVQNLGGIANVTFLPAGCDVGDVIAFDTGPGNMVIDRVASRASGGRRHYDRGGRLARRGRVDGRLLGEMMRHAFIRRRPPKTAGREQFGAAFTDAHYQRARRRGMDDADVAATATAFTAASIAEAYDRFGPASIDEVLLCGGGVSNPVLVAMIAERLAGGKVTTTDAYGIDADAKEAVSFALLAAATIRGLAGNVPSATGAARPVVLGKIIPGG